MGNTTSASPRFTQSNQSTDKVLSIIELLSYAPEPLRLIDIATQLSFNPSTALRFLNSLEQNGYIYKDPETAKYKMTFKLCALAQYISSHTELVQIASGPMQKLSNTLGECVCLAVEQNYSIVYIHVCDGPGQMLRTTQRIGTSAPMHCTGVGKVILSGFEEEQIEKMISLKGLTKFTEYTLTTKESLMEEIKQIRIQGYAYDNQECELGARCIAFPLRDYTGKIVASLSVTGPARRMTDEFIDSNFKKILEVVHGISYLLGYSVI